MNRKTIPIFLLVLLCLTAFYCLVRCSDDSRLSNRELAIQSEIAKQHCRALQKYVNPSLDLEAVDCKYEPTINSRIALSFKCRVQQDVNVWVSFWRKTGALWLFSSRTLEDLPLPSEAEALQKAEAILNAVVKISPGTRLLRTRKHNDAYEFKWIRYNSHDIPYFEETHNVWIGGGGYLKRLILNPPQAPCEDAPKIDESTAMAIARKLVVNSDYQVPHHSKLFVGDPRRVYVEPSQPIKILFDPNKNKSISRLVYRIYFTPRDVDPEKKYIGGPDDRAVMIDALSGEVIADNESWSARKYGMIWTVR